MCSLRRLASLVALAVIALAVPARAGVIVVDISGAGEFTSLPLALSSAVDGDTLLIRPGDYSGQAGFLTINSRTLTLAADGSGAVIVPPLRVQDSDGTHRVLLRGLKASAVGAPSTVMSGLEVVGAFNVVAEACEFTGRNGIQTPDSVAPAAPGRPGINVLLGHAVLKDCIAQGGRGADTLLLDNPFTSWGGPGVDAQFGSVQVYGGSLTGGKGGTIIGYPTGPGTFPNTGGEGIVVNAGSYVAGATLTGGDGGDGDDLEHPAFFHKGGDAFKAAGPYVVESLDNTLVPGQGGFDGEGQQGPAGQATALGPGAVLVTYSGPFRDYGLGPPTPEGSSLQFHYSGQPGDAVGIFISLGTGELPLPGKQGVWHLGAPLFGPYVFFAPSGTLSLSLTVPAIGLGPDGALLLYEQAFVKPAVGPALLSSPTTHLIVDNSL